MPKVRKMPKKSPEGKNHRKDADWVVEIGPVPSVREHPIESSHETIEIDKWLKLVATYWKKGARRKA